MDNDKKISGEFILNPEGTAKTEEKKPEPKPTSTTSSALAHDPSNHIHMPEVEAKMGFHNKPHFYSSTAFYPEGFTFENQQEGEEVVLVVRRDFITNLPWILGALVLALLPLAIIPFLPVLVPFLTIPPLLQTLYLAFYYLAVFGFILVNFTLWYFHVGIVTNIRVVDVDVHGILSRDIASTLIADIEDVGYTQVGVIRSIFNYGDVYIQTAAEKRNFEFDKAPEPQLIVQIVQRLMSEEQAKEYEQ